MTYRTAVFAALLLCAGAAAATAEQGVTEETETPYTRVQEVSFLGGFFVDGTTHRNISASYFLGLRRHFGLDFDLSNSSPGNGDITTVTAGIAFPFSNKADNFTGFVSGGAGLTRSSADLGDRGPFLPGVDTIAWDFTFDAGMGGLVRITDSGLFWRFDYRFFLLLVNENGDTDHYHRVTTGLTKRF